MEMVDCKFCGEDAGYLPFKCSYCGEKYCKVHRLPENHKCTMENAEKIIAEKKYGTDNKNAPPTTRYSTNGSNKSTNRPRQRNSSISSMEIGNKINNLSGAATIILVEIIFLILFFIPVISTNILVSWGKIMTNPLTAYSIITAMFVPTTYIGGFSIISLVFHFVIFYFVGRNLEERYSKKRLLMIYWGGALITSVSIVLFQLLFSISQLFSFTTYYVFYASGGGTIAIILFWASLSPNQVIRLYLYFIPIRLKLKQVLLIFIGLQLIPGIFSLINASQGVADPNFILNFANLMALLSGYINLQKEGAQQMSFR